MISLNKISVLALLCLISTSAWSARVDFCKVKEIYDEKDISMPPRISYEDCSGEAYLGSIGKDSVRAACWAGATNLLEGKCENHKEADSKKAADENLESGAETE